ncbi:MAG: hypothetical protein JNM24_02885 [Bdellovibrionaceae bacterium]|nr:hypothetical protein [Pseudobdellovibrionaceae bacterium]
MNKENKDKQNDNQTDHQLGMLGLLAIGALIWKNEDKIKLWFYENIILLILGGIFLLALAGFYLWYRLKKKEKVYFDNLAKLKKLEPQKQDIHYYKRKDFDERNLSR